MTNEDFKYLNKHLETLSELKKSGYRCDADMKQIEKRMKYFFDI